MIANEVQIRFWSKVQISPTCWIWCGSKMGAGYGEIRLNGKKLGAHQLSYLIHFGEYDRSKDIHHVCEVKLCVNPDHLTVMSRRDNLMASNTVTRRNAEKTHCKCGERLVVVSKKGRGCRSCLNRQQREWQAKTKAKKLENELKETPKVVY